jgi:hypothetical protein
LLLKSRDLRELIVGFYFIVGQRDFDGKCLVEPDFVRSQIDLNLLSVRIIQEEKRKGYENKA